MVKYKTLEKEIIIMRNENAMMLASSRKNQTRKKGRGEKQHRKLLTM
jgi:hypothetical protein